MIDKLIDNYNTQIARLKRLAKIGQEDITKPQYSIETLKETFSTLCSFFNSIKEMCWDFNPAMRKPDEHEVEEYDDQPGYPLIAMIDYRDDVIPVYNDDYGQCYFCIVEGEEMSGGTYEMEPTRSFCRFYDQVHDYNILFKDIENESKTLQK